MKITTSFADADGGTEVTTPARTHQRAFGPKTMKWARNNPFKS